MKLVSWNVNGIRAVIKKDFYESVKKLNPDILCIQETKIHEPHDELDLKEYPYHYWDHAEKKGYSGTAIFSKIKPINVKYGVDMEEHDKEGRVITAEFEDFFLVTVYTPNSKHGLLRLDYRQQWDAHFLEKMKELEENKPVIFCGDLNVAHQEIDLKNPKSNRKNPGFSDEERAGFDNIVRAGFTDTFRYLYPDKIKYTWWSYMFHARSKNIGWRIDYFCISNSLIPKLQEATIHDDILGSDHCPVSIELK